MGTWIRTSVRRGAVVRKQAIPVVSWLVCLLLSAAGDTKAQSSEPIPVLQAGPTGDWCATQRMWDLKADLSTQSGSAACPTYGSCDVAATRNTYVPNPYQSFTTIRLMFHIITLDNGANASATPAMIAAQVNNLNNDYAPSRINFEYEYQTHASTAFRSLADSEMDIMKQAFAYKPDSVLNVYVAYVEQGYSYGTFPWDPDCLTFRGGIVMTNGHFDYVQSTLAHEVGHCLGLWHTHHGVSEMNQCSQCWERAGATDGDLVGDFCEDTDPTPTNYQCSGPGGTDPCSGNPWGPTDPQNYMGYSGESCWSEFSPSQRGRMHCWLTARLMSWTAGVRFTHTVPLGEAPHAVDFMGITGKVVNDWQWNFGDGQTSNAQSPSHSYADPGIYDVSVGIQATDGYYESVRRDLVWVYADTIAVDTVQGVSGMSTLVEIYARNYLPVSEIILPLGWAGPAGIWLDSISTAGLRTAYLGYQEYLHYDDYSKRMTYRLATSSGQSELPPGTGPVLRAYFGAPPETAVDNAVSLLSYSTPLGTYNPTHVALPGEYHPVAISGLIKGCKPGDVNGNGVTNLLDLMYMIHYLTGNVPSVPNPSAANVDGMGLINSLDLARMIQYLMNKPVDIVCGP